MVRRKWVRPRLCSSERVTPTALDAGILWGLQVSNNQAWGLLTGRAASHLITRIVPPATLADVDSSAWPQTPPAGRQQLPHLLQLWLGFWCPLYNPTGPQSAEAAVLTPMRPGSYITLNQPTPPHLRNESLWPLGWCIQLKPEIKGWDDWVSVFFLWSLCPMALYGPSWNWGWGSNCGLWPNPDNDISWHLHPSLLSPLSYGSWLLSCPKCAPQCPTLSLNEPSPCFLAQYVLL